MNIYTSLDMALAEIWDALLDAPRVLSRGKATREYIGESFLLTNPRARLCTIPGRKWSHAYAVGELLWYLAGSNELDMIKFYAPSYARFSDDERTLYGAYGPRINSQWRTVISKILDDPGTRQAVISIYSERDTARTKTKDFPCTIALQFLLRSNGLNLICTMRSNDTWLGLPYDVFCFTMLQEIMAFQLGVDLGWYMHQVGSLHLYEQDVPKVETLRSELFMPRQFEMKPLFNPSLLGDVDGVSLLIKSVCKMEREIRKTSTFEDYPMESSWFDDALAHVHFLKTNKLPAKYKNWDHLWRLRNDHSRRY